MTSPGFTDLVTSNGRGGGGGIDGDNQADQVPMSTGRKVHGDMRQRVAYLDDRAEGMGVAWRES